jgi:hypothetical protein
MAVKQGSSPKVSNRKKARRGIQPGDKPVARKKTKKTPTGAANGSNNCFFTPQGQASRPATPVRLTNRPSDTNRSADNQPEQKRLTPVDGFMQVFTEHLEQLATKKRWSPELRKQVNQFAQALVYENSPMPLRAAGEILSRSNSTALKSVIYRFVATYRHQVGSPRYHKALQLPGTQAAWFLPQFDRQVEANRARKEQLQSVS